MIPKMLLALLMSATASPAFAQSGVNSGRIVRVEADTYNGNNAGFRIFLEGFPALCGNSHVWAFINKADDNSQVSIALLNSAWLTGRTVTIYTNAVGGAGHCHIHYVVAL